MIHKLPNNSYGTGENSLAADEEEVFVFPLSFAQQRLWFLDQLIPNSPIYNIPGAVQFQGRLDRVALEKSFSEIVRRHEALRTTFVIADGQPMQAVAAVEQDSNLQRYYSLQEIDLSHLSEPNRQTEIARLATAGARQPFNLEQEPLLRVTLLCLSEQEYIFLTTIHHIISDGWSLSMFMRELMALYHAFSQGQPSPLLDLPIQYADFALWQRECLQGELLTSKLAYWQRQLAGSLPVLQLPTQRTRPAVQSFLGARQTFALSSKFAEALKSFARQESVTVFMTLLTAFKTLLYRYTGQEDILVGSPVANRQRPELEGLMGFFVNTLVLRTDLSGNPSFRELLTRVREVTLEADAHQDVPFEKLVEALQIERELSRNPLFQVAFVIAPPMPVLTPPWSYCQLDMDTGTAKFDLTLAIEERPEGFICAFEYSTDLFEADAIARMVGHFQTLLAGILANPDQCIGELPLLTASEWQQMQSWNQTQVDYPQGCIHQLFEAQVEKNPDAVAMVFGEQQLTYRELNTKANQLAHYLQSLGVGPEVLVGICVERSLYTLIGILGIFKAGGAYLPLDPAYPAERLAFMLEDAQVPVLLTQHSLGIERTHRQSLQKTTIVHLDNWQANTDGEENPVSGVTSDNLAYTIYTSGSTGKPKGVLLTHHGLCNLAKAQQQLFNVQPNHRVLQFASLSFDASIWEIVMAWVGGATIVLAQQDDLLPGNTLLKLLRDQQIAIVTLPPSALAVLPAAELPDLQTIIVAGEACPPELVKRWAPGRRFFNAYGPTESTVCATVAECNPGDQKLPIGYPIANTQVYILDANLQPVPVGVPGEIYIAGVGLARGYLNRPELTAEKFILKKAEGAGSREQGSHLDLGVSRHSPQVGRPAHGGGSPSRASGVAGGEFLTPHSSLLTQYSGLRTQHSQERLYKTGDLARYLPNGNIEYLGRIDNQVKIRGFRIELGEIETVVSQHPDVKEAIAIAREDLSGDKRLVAYIVWQPKPNRVPYESECLAELDGYGTVQLQTEDISVGGACLVGVPEMSVTQHLRLCLTLPGTTEAQWFSGKIVWQEGTKAGIQFQVSPSEQAVLNQSVEYLLKTGGFLKVLQRTAVESLRSFLKQKLPDYMMPSSFVFLDTLPHTPNGKVDRKKLPAPENLRSQLNTSYTAPQTEIEQAIASVWQQVLQVDKVGLHDNFFDLGGHSLRMAQVHTQLCGVLQQKISMVELFQYPTVSALAKHLSQENEAQPTFAQSHQRANKQKEALHLQKQRMQRKKENG
ncbi:MAG: amino acid adenylation domain-containing protein [Aulosira sp. ZfuCHP01]|nr:amino acid adenylation domain-containing protein [Aulosira sp. ZfuVER01]MDZ7999958.1 amino acid adenylation domain-containing protein [Aulosira sp. DedVER01a]MDZ8051397.1 amino acid adenylation domain-containing protein [Aulosira sp. ZfuCHP01]